MQKILKIFMCLVIVCLMGVSTAQATISINGTEDNIARNVTRTGYPSIAESDNGWGDGTDKWDIVDGARTYAAWQNGLGFTGGERSWGGQSAGWRHAVIDFGEEREFNKMIVWHFRSPDIPSVVQLSYWNEEQSAWVEILSSTDGYDYLMYPVEDIASHWPSDQGVITNVYPMAFNFSRVTSRKVRFSLDNRPVVGNPYIEHGWIFEIEVYNESSYRSGLVAHYPFTTDATDSSGNNHHGNNHGATIGSGTAQFDGDDYIDLGTTETLGIKKTDTLDLTTPHFVTYIYNRESAEFEIYLDGQKIGKASVESGYYINGKLLIGDTWIRTGAYTHEGLVGAINEARVYSKALSQEEVTQLYNRNSVTSDLVAFYEFSSDTSDTSGNGHDGINHGATISDGKAQFDGDDYIDLGTTEELGIRESSFSLTAWVEASGGTLAGPIFGSAHDSLMRWIWEHYWEHSLTEASISNRKLTMSFYNYPVVRGLLEADINDQSFTLTALARSTGGVLQGPVFGSAHDGALSNAWGDYWMHSLTEASIDNENLVMSFYNYPIERGVLFNPIPGSTDLTIWNRFTYVYDSASGTFKTYLNAQELGTASVDLNYYLNGKLTIGDTWINTGYEHEGFVGEIDDVRIYNRALSAAEIGALR